MLRVGVVDDQALVRTGFSMILESEPDFDVVCEAADGRDAVELCRRYRPDVVLMDIRMPELDGIAATRLITGDPDNRTRVLMLTTFDIDEYVYDLVAAVRVLAAGEALLAPSVTRRLIEEFVSGSSDYTPAPGLADLTGRETDVLKAIARGLSNHEIATELFLGETTIKTHVSRVLMKLGVRDRVQAVVTAYESGLVRPGRQQPPST